MKHKKVDALIVGAGFAGMYMLYRLRLLGLNVLVVDKAGGVGGTWYWNRYPGARCDIESMQYSYSFSNQLQQEWVWSERYATQGEILEYANHVAQRFQLLDHIQFNTQVISAIYNQDDKTHPWQVSLVNVDSDSNQQPEKIDAQFCIMATGCLSEPNLPNIQGVENFSRECYHTGQWPHEEISFENKRVALIGTGSSGIQATTAIARQAKHLTVFQRTANYIIPGNNQPFKPGEQDKIKENYSALRDLAKRTRNGVAQEVVTESALSFSPQQREAQYRRRWEMGGLTFVGAFGDLLLNADSNQTAAQFVRDKIEEIVEDKETARLLSPTSTLGCKRLCVDSDYFATFNRKNVELVDISETGITRITSHGPQVEDKVFEADMIVFATGFDAMTGALNKIDIKGLGGQRLKDRWCDGPKTYLGLMTAEFPNMFLITGPGSPSVLSNVLTSIEYHVEWISNCIDHLLKHDFVGIEATSEAEAEWAEIINKVVNMTLYRTCNSWYLGSNIPDKARVFMPFPGVPPYEKRCNKIADDGYPGFKLIAR